MSHSSRRLLLVSVLAGCLSIGLLAPAASHAKVTNSDLLQMDQRILDRQQRILDKLSATKNLLEEVDLNVDNLSPKVSQVLNIVGNLGPKISQVLNIVGNLGPKVSQVLTILGNLSGKVDQVLTTVNTLSANLSRVIDPLLCQLLGICTAGAESP
jgi:phage-related minor tail protein